MNALSSRAASALAMLTAGLGADGISAATTLRRLEPMPRGAMPKRVRITAGPPEPLTDLRSLIRVCPGGKHGIFRAFGADTRALIVRKPFDAETITWTPEVQQQAAV